MCVCVCVCVHVVGVCCTCSVGDLLSLQVNWHVIVDYNCHLLDINPPSTQIGSYQKLLLALTIPEEEDKHHTVDSEAAGEGEREREREREREGEREGERER